MEKDFAIFGRNVRQIRLAQDMSMKHLAGVSGIGVNTLARIQRAESCSERTQQKLAHGLNIRLESLWLPEFLETTNYCHFRNDNTRWSFIDLDQARSWPLNDTPGRQDPDRIQAAEERLRLGKLGKSSGFSRIFRSHLATGIHGACIAEVYAKHDVIAGANVEAVFHYCLRGTLRIFLGDDVIMLREGEGLTWDTHFSYAHEPATPLGPKDLPPLFLGVTLNLRNIKADRVRKSGD